VPISNVSSRWRIAIFLAVLIECGLIAGLHRALTIEPQSREPAPTTVVFERPQPLPSLRPPPPTPTPTPPPTPQPPVVHPVIPPVRPVTVAIRRPAAKTRPLLTHATTHAPAPVKAVPAVVAVATAAPVAISAPPQAAPSSAAVATPAPVATATSQYVDPAVLAAYNAKLTAAVQAAFHVPGTAADMGFKGRVQVEFTMRNGVLTNVRVDVPSGLVAVDRAAVRAVQTANYPLPPQVLIGKDGTYQIWVACV
jgi:protein TonB